LTPFAGCAASIHLAALEIDDFDPFWIVARHANIIALSRQQDLVLNGDRATALAPRATDEQVAR
jgi:hypothetical protein